MRAIYHDGAWRTVGPEPDPVGWYATEEEAQRVCDKAHNKLKRASEAYFAKVDYRAAVRAAHACDVPGVTWNLQYKQWQANIYMNGENRMLGRFDLKMDAIRARRKMDKIKAKRAAVRAATKERRATAAALKKKSAKKKHISQDIMKNYFKERKKY